MTASMMAAILPLIAAWTSGISIYLTVAILGILGNAGVLPLPGELEVLKNPLIIGAAIAIYVIEFLADKVPFIDSMWDSVHTFIRPLGAAGLGVLAGAEQGPIAQTLYAMTTGTLALGAHTTKATTRLAINTSPEPFSNIGASLAEHSFVIFIFWFFIKHPFLACALLALIIFLSFLIVRLLWRFAKKIFYGIRGTSQIKNEVGDKS